MAGTAKKSGWAKRIAVIAGWAVAILMTLTLALTGVGIVLMTGQTGRDIVENLVDGRQIAGYGEVQLSGLSGNPLDRLVIDTLTVSDEDGVWLRAEDIVLDWRPRALLGRHLDIQELSVTRTEIQRRPVRAEREETGGGVPQFQISVGDLSLDTIHLAEDVAGPEATLTAGGALARESGIWQARLDIMREEGEDRLNLEAVFGRRIVLDASLVAPAGGPLATLLRAPETRLQGDIELEGTRAQGRGGIGISAGGEAVILAAFDWADGQATLDGQAHPGRWPGLAILDRLLGGTAEFAIRVPLRDNSLLQPDLSAPRAEIRAPHLELDIQRGAEQTLALDIRQGAGLVSALTGGQVDAESLSAQGIVSLEGNRSFTGEISATGLDLPIARFEQAQGPLSLSGPFTRPHIVTELRTQGARFTVDTLDRALGDQPTIEADMIYSRETGDLSFERLVVTGAAGRAEALGLFNPETGRFTLQLRQSDIVLAPLRDDLSGTVRLQGQAEGNWRGPVEFNAELTSRNLGGQAGEILGETLEARARGQWQGGTNIVFENLQADSPALQLDMTGDILAEGWTAEGEALWRGDAPVSAVALDGEAAIVFDARYLAGRLDARTQIETSQVSAGPVTLIGPVLRLEAEGPLDALSGEWRLNAETGSGPVDLAGQFSRRDETIRFPGIDGRFGAFSVAGELTAAPQSMQFDLTATPVAGFGELTAQGSLTEGVLDVSLDAHDMVQGDLVYLDRLEARAQGPLETVDLSLTAQGAYGARFQGAAEGSLQLAGGPLEARLTLEGEYGNVPIRTIEPIVLARADQGLTLDAQLAIAEGTAALSLSDAENVPVLELDFEQIPARLSSYPRNRAPMSGTLSGEGSLRLAPDGWTGQATIDGNRLQPAEREDGLEVDARLGAQLTRQGLTIELTGSAMDLRLSADLALDSGPVTSFEGLTASQTAISGEAHIDGEVAPVAAFLLPADQLLEGQLDADARISGTIETPDLTGQANLTAGAFVERQQGLEIRDISMLATFEEDGLTIPRIEGSGVQGGRLTGEGRISFAGARMTGGASLEFTDLTLVSRPKLTAVGDGEVNAELDGRTIAVSGETRLDRVEARPPEGGRKPIPHIQVTEVNVPGEGSAEIVPPPRPDYTVQLDYHIVADNRVFVRSDQFDSEWSLDLTVTGTASEPILDGTARLIRGDASMLGQRFNFESGVVTFSGAPGEAELNIVAVRQTRDITARVRVAGTAQAPRIELGSTPSLPEDEIASRLLFGQRAGNLSGVQAAQLAGALAGAAGGFDPFSALRGLAGLDQLAIVSDPEGGTIVSGGRYVTDDVYLELTSTDGGAAPTTSIEWQLTSRFTLESTLGGSGQTGIAISWRRDYDDLDDLGWW